MTDPSFVARTCGERVVRILISTIMATGRFFHRHAAGAFVTVTVVAVVSLLIGGVANAAPPSGARQAIVTITSLRTSPASLVAHGSPMTLTATITPATASGTVQFKDAAGQVLDERGQVLDGRMPNAGATNLGSPVTVSNGAASGSTSTLARGSHQLTAMFTPADPARFSPSTSLAVLLTVTGPTRAAGATTTSLRTFPASPVAQGSPVTLTATIIPATAAGTVQFKDGTTNRGNPVTVSNGTASGSTSTLAVGSHQLTAVFIPTDPAAFSASTSPPVRVTVTTSTGVATTTARMSTFPASPVRRGTQVTLTATIAPATAVGTVQFKDGTTYLGNPVIVGNGAAYESLSTLPVGSHQLTAVFTPADPAVFSPSTSPVLAFEVTEPGLGDLNACLRVLQNCPGPR